MLDYRYGEILKFLSITSSSVQSVIMKFEQIVIVKNLHGRKIKLIQIKELYDNYVKKEI